MGSSAIPALSRSERRVSRCATPQCFLGEFFPHHRGRLKQVIEARLDGRLDASDVIQEALVRVTTQRTASPESPVWPPYLWLRKIVLWTLAELQRKHLGAQARDVRRELPFDYPFPSGVSGMKLVERLLDSITSPSQAAHEAERALQVRMALEQLEPLDREVLVLRHVEQLTRSQTAEVLGVSTAAAAKRYVRALTRCRSLLDQLDRSDG